MATMNPIQELLDKLRARGWTDAAIATELGGNRETVAQWRRGEWRPRFEPAMVMALETLMARRKIPKRRRGSRYTNSDRYVKDADKPSQ